MLRKNINILRGRRLRPRPRRPPVIAKKHGIYQPINLQEF